MREQRPGASNNYVCQSNKEEVTFLNRCFSPFIVSFGQDLIYCEENERYMHHFVSTFYIYTNQTHLITMNLI